MSPLQRFQPYFRYFRPLRGQLALALCCLAVYSAASGIGLPTILEKIFKPLFEDQRDLSLRQIVGIVMLVPAVFVVRGITGYLGSYLFQVIGTRVLEALRVEFFRKLQVLPLSFLQGFPSGELASRGLSDAQQLQATLTLVVSDGIKHPLTLVGALGYIVWKAVEAEGVALALVCLLLVPLSVFPVRYVARKVLHRARQAQEELGSVSAQIVENLAAAREVRAFGLEQRTVGRFRNTSESLLRAQLKIAKYSLGLNPVIEVLSAVGIAFTLAYAYVTGVEFEALLAVITALFMCYEPIKKLGYLNSQLKRGTASLDRLEPVLFEPESIADPAAPETLGRARGEVAFEQVNFAYNSDAPVLHDVSVTIPAGTVCALVGPSGAGKSTFANLVPRFFDVAGGRVCVDGHDVRSLRLADLRRQIAVVSQDPVLFNDTIYQNLLLGRPDATREEVIAAARDASAHEFITGLPEGFETMVGERGARLSGGQKQRIALARAFLRQAPILILDEATSALDSESEAAIQQALKKLMAGRTVLIIAHRFSTIRDASLILVFEDGRVIARGTHPELHAGNDLYRTLYDRQASLGG